MATIDTEAYQEMIQALQDFMTNVSDACDTMETAGNDCVDNMENDPSAVSANSRLQKSLGQFRGTFETVQKVIEGLQYQLEEVQRQQVNFDSE